MKTITVFLDGVDFQHELGETTVTTYASVDSLKKSSKCWSQCGIVKVKLKVNSVEWVEPQNFNKEIEG
jgi:hypothetical protein